MEQPASGSAPGAKASHDKPFAPCPARPSTAGSAGTGTPHGLHRREDQVRDTGLSARSADHMQAPPALPLQAPGPIVVCADDHVASSPGVSEAIAALVETGLLSATSCMSGASTGAAPRRRCAH